MATKVAAGRRLLSTRTVRSPAVLPGLIVLVAGLALAPFDGGFSLTVWYPAALFLLALLVSVVVAAPPTWAERSRLVELALGAYALFCAWTFLSMTWAGMPDLAWDGANRVLLYGVVLVLACLRPWSTRAATAALALVGFGTAVIAVGLLVTAVTGPDPAKLFLEGRLAAPTGYLNASANLWLIGFFPAVHVATARTAPWPVRGLGLAAATLLLQVALLSQSRGAAIAFVATVVIFVVLTPRRWPVLAAVLVVVGLTVLASDALLDVREASADELSDALERAVGAIALSSVAGLVFGAVAAVAGLRSRPWLSARPGVGRAGDLALVVLAVCLSAAVLVAIGNPAAWADARWSDFKSAGYTAVDEGRTRFGGSLGSGRYDFYRVAIAEFQDHPVRGIGASNFGAEYLQQRRTAEAPANPHSLFFRILSQLGVVGVALFAAFLALMLTAALRARRGGSSDHAAVVVAALMGALIWLAQSAGDWLWEFPALAMLAFGMLGVAARARPAPPVALDHAHRPPAEPTGRRVGGSIAVRLVLAISILAAAISLAVPGVAARYASAGYDAAPRDPELALERLERASTLNRLSTEPLVAQGVLAQRLGELDVAADAFRRALERSPGNWFAHFELGLVSALRGDLRAAEPSLREAVRLNPRQPVAREALATIRRGEAVDPQVLEERLNAQLEARFDASDPDEASDSDD